MASSAFLRDNRQDRSLANRVERLRDKAVSADQAEKFIERFYLLDKAYREHKDEPYAIRHAHITSDMLAAITIVVDEDDLIVGRVKKVIPSDQDQQLVTQLRIEHDPNARGEMRIYPGMSYLDCPEVREALNGPTWCFPGPTWYGHAGHIIPDWEELLKKGTNGIKEKARRKLAEFDADDPEQESKRLFLEGIMISCDAISGFGLRYAAHIEILAEKESDPRRREELLQMKEVCTRVPANPARNFHEAIQSIWFIDLIFHQVAGSRDYALGRMDQYLHEIYSNDLEAGTLSREQALELLACLFIKQNELGLVLPDNATSTQYVTIGGKTVDGSSIANQVSILVLEAIDKLRLPIPCAVVRYSSGMDRELWHKTCDVARRANTLILTNDEVFIPAYVKCGVSSKHAVEYGQVGCNNPGLTGRTCPDREYWMNLPKFLELSLNDGYDSFIDSQVGPQTGKAESLKTFEDLMTAFKAQISFWVERVVRERGKYYKEFTENRPFSLESILMKDTVEMAMDINSSDRNPPTGTGYTQQPLLGGGIATVADSLIAIKKLVYEEGRMSLQNLNDILKNNFAGHEELRLELRNQFPKYGNDDDDVDSIAAEVALYYCEEVVRQRDKHAGLSLPGIYSYMSYLYHGMVTGATADGRLAKEPVSENQQAVNGLDREGATALLNSMQKLKPAFRFTPFGGSTVTLNRSAVSSEKSVELLEALFETYFEGGGLQVMPNVVDVQMLRDAKVNPENYENLVVRVTGYSARFVDLAPEVQDIVIARSETGTG
jgi:formate C-acetyltransferase